jgi:YVTN family beta-propeller protein
VTATITVGTNPIGVAVDPAAGTVYVANSSGTVSVISTATNKVTATVAVGAGPDAVAVDPATHAVYVTDNAASTVSVISGSRYRATCTTAALPAGRDTITAAYPGDPGYAPAAATLTQTVTERTRATPHHALTLTATLTTTGRPLSAQPVTFSSGGTLLCTTLTSTRGTASCATAAQPGPHHAPIHARYAGNASYQPSSATATPPS